MNLEDHIRSIPDHPKPGILFRDITTLLASPAAFRGAVARLCEIFQSHNVEFVAGIEARGFTIGGAIAIELGAGFVPIRKAGKLPAATVAEDYELEYGTDRIEIHTDVIEPGQNVLLVDDLIATGGTALAAASLLKRVNAEIIGAGFIVDLPDLGGMDELRATGVDAVSLVQFPGH